MAYTSSTLSLIVPRVGAAGVAIWSYTNTDAYTDIDPAGYITDGGDRGMKVGDVVMYYDTDTTVHYMTRVESVSSTAPGAVNLGLPVAITSATTGD